MLLRTIKMPRNMMYVTEHLPSSAYAQENTMRIPETFKQKRLTAEPDGHAFRKNGSYLDIHA